LQGNYTVISALSLSVPPFLFGLSWLETARFREQGRQKGIEGETKEMNRNFMGEITNDRMSFVQ
jgi:hypothetical protein